MAGKTFPFTRTNAEWRQILTPEQYEVVRAHGTEDPGSCALLLEKRPGTFSCAGCGSLSSNQRRNLKAAPAGQASTIRSTAP